MVSLGLHTFYMQEMAIIKDITRDNHGTTVRKYQPMQSIFIPMLTARAGNAKIILQGRFVYNNYTLCFCGPAVRQIWRTNIVKGS